MKGRGPVWPSLTNMSSMTNLSRRYGLAGVHRGRAASTRRIRAHARRAAPIFARRGPRRRLPNWDVIWRRQLVDNLGILVRQLWQVGIREIFADGSFVEDKEHPNDIDGYFVCQLRELASE